MSALAVQDTVFAWNDPMSENEKFAELAGTWTQKKANFYEPLFISFHQQGGGKRFSKLRKLWQRLKRKFTKPVFIEVGSGAVYKHILNQKIKSGEMTWAEAINYLRPNLGEHDFDYLTVKPEAARKLAEDVGYKISKDDSKKLIGSVKRINGITGGKPVELELDCKKYEFADYMFYTDKKTKRDGEVKYKLDKKALKKVEYLDICGVDHAVASREDLLILKMKVQTSKQGVIDGKYLREKDIVDVCNLIGSTSNWDYEYTKHRLDINPDIKKKFIYNFNKFKKYINKNGEKNLDGLLYSHKVIEGKVTQLYDRLMPLLR